MALQSPSVPLAGRCHTASPSWASLRRWCSAYFWHSQQAFCPPAARQSSTSSGRCSTSDVPQPNPSPVKREGLPDGLIPFPLYGGSLGVARRLGLGGLWPHHTIFNVGSISCGGISN